MAGNDIEAVRASPRCGAKTRKGTPCQAPAVKGKRRCRMHGGAPGSGAPIGNINAFKHGYYSAVAISERKMLRDLLRTSLETLEEFEES